MPLTIKTLRATVKVKSKQRGSPLHEPPRPERPSLEFAMPIGQELTQGDPDPNKMATQGKGPASNRAPLEAKNADPKKIADRVYELMRREITQGKQLGGFTTDARRR